MYEIFINFINPYLNLIIMGFNSIFKFRFLIPPFVLLFYLQNKYSDKDFFGLSITTWEYWSGKTYKNSLENKKYSENWVFIISNISNSYVDIVFNSSFDLERIFTYLITYAEITNNKEFIENWFRPISFNIDEVHKYFFSRTFDKNISEEKLMVITQLRKRSILGNLITQELAQLDIFFRRLTWWIIKRYYEWLGFVRFRKLFYVSNPEETNLEDETKSKLIKRWLYLAPNFLLLLSKNRREMYKEKWVSKIIVGFEDKLNDLTFTDFLQKIYNPETEQGQKFWNIYYKYYKEKEFLKDFNNLKNIEKRKEEIKEKYEEMQLKKKENAIKKFFLNFDN